MTICTTNYQSRAFKNWVTSFIYYFPPYILDLRVLPLRGCLLIFRTLLFSKLKELQTQMWSEHLLVLLLLSSCGSHHPLTLLCFYYRARDIEFDKDNRWEEKHICFLMHKVCYCTEPLSLMLIWLGHRCWALSSMCIQICVLNDDRTLCHIIYCIARFIVYYLALVGLHATYATGLAIAR